MFKILGVLGAIFALLPIFTIFSAEKMLFAGIAASKLSHFIPLGIANGLQVFHGIVLVVLAVLSLIVGRSMYLALSGIFFVVGILFHTTSVYLFVFKGIQGVLPFAYIGLVCFIIGWVLFIIDVVLSHRLHERKAIDKPDFPHRND